MDIFNKIGKKASATYKVTAEKTGKLAKEAKLRMKMNENKSDIEGLYKQIGKKVYEKHLTDESINIKDVLEEEITKIDVLSDEIENILKEIMSLKDLKQCPNCYEKVEKTAKYCPNCGAEQEEIQTEEPESTDNNDVSSEDIDSIDAKDEEQAKEVEIVNEKSSETANEEEDE